MFNADKLISCTCGDTPSRGEELLQPAAMIEIYARPGNTKISGLQIWFALLQLPVNAPL